MSRIIMGKASMIGMLALLFALFTATVGLRNITIGIVTSECVF
jgi:hypothetical protein